MNLTPDYPIQPSPCTIEASPSANESKLRVFAYSELESHLEDYQNTLHRLLLSDDGGFLISDFPTEENQSLLNLAAAFGQAFPAGYELDSHPMEEDVIYRIESRCNGEGLRANLDFMVTSTTSKAFSCHTDGFCSVGPADFICMLCVQAAPDEGFTTLIQLKTILAHLTEREIRLLRRPAFPAKQGLVPILYELNGELYIRFNKLDIDHFSAFNNHVLTRECREVVEHVEDICSFSKQSSRFLLQSGDCLWINNRTLLHGRTGFSHQSKRLMKRLWVRATNRAI